MKFAVHVRSGRSATSEFAERLKEEINAAGGMVLDHDGDRPDMVLAVGGDGTMLAAVQSAIAHDVPVLGFNLGTLGFLTEAEPDDLQTVVKRLFSGDYEIAERMTITASTGDLSATGVNDVVVEKIDSTRLVSLAVVIDGTEFATYRADGLIVAAKLDTGADTSSLHAENIRWEKRADGDWVAFDVIGVTGEKARFEHKVVRVARIKRNSEPAQSRPTILMGVCLGNVYKLTEVNLTDRSRFNYEMLVGRSFLAGRFAVDSARMNTVEPACKEAPGR